MISRIKRLPLRQVWKHEALDFTTWLEDNVDVLNDALDLDLSNVEREKSAGAFSIDLVAEDAQGSPVIIENQLEKSNHDHLGKLITYLTAMTAKAAIWIVADPRPEHVNAISWLNESSSASFYLLKVEAIKIDDSPPAPLLTLIVGPSEEARQVGKAKKEMAERYLIRKRFWAQMLDRAKDKTSLHSNISPSPHNWVGASAGMKALGLNYAVRQHSAQVELYIDQGKGCDEENRLIFEALESEKDEIEEVFGEPLEWQSLEGKQACRIRKQIEVGGYRDDEEKWSDIHNVMIDAMIRLEKALRPHIERIRA